MRFARMLAGALGCALSALAQPGLLKAGAAVVDITPASYPVIVNAMFTERTASQAADPLEARALVLDNGVTQAALAIVDSCMVPRPLIDQAKAEASRRTGIPAAQILVAATHTHSAPAAMGCLGSRADTNYAAALPARMAQAIVLAHERLQPARLGWTAFDAWHHTFNRRWIRRPDRMVEDPFGQRTARAHMHPGHQSADAIGPSGPVDPGLSILAVETLAGRPLALLANYSQHYYGSPLLSADYFGRFNRELAALLAPEPGQPHPFVAMMSQGTSGDLMWMDYSAPRREIGFEAYARELAALVHQAYGQIAFTNWVPLRVAERKLPLSYRVPSAERLEWARQKQAALGTNLPQTLPEVYALEAIHLHERRETELVLQAWRIGGLGLTALPNEVFALTGLKLKAQSPLQPAFNIELANGAEGYIPPPEQHALGGYTTWPARTAGLEVEAEPKIVEALLQLLEEVAEKPRRALAPAHGPYARAVLESRPEAYWRLEEMSGRVAQDSAGGHHAEYEGGVALYLPGPGSGEGSSPDPALKPSPFSGPGAINRSVHLAGGNLRANFPGLSGAADSVVFWFWNGLPDDARPVTAYLFSREAGPGVGGPNIGLGGTDHPETRGRLFFHPGGETDAIARGATVLERRRWYQLALVRAGAEFTLYLDGKPELSGRTARSVPHGPVQLLFGGKSGTSASLEGKIDEVAVYDRALAAAEVLAQYQLSGLAPASAGPRTSSPPLSPEESMRQIVVKEGFKVELAAAEPLVLDPVAIDWDLAGRLWVVEMADYPLGLDGRGAPGGRVRILEDRDQDGRFERSTLFAEKLSFPAGIITWRDGALVAAGSEILFLRDADGDGRAEAREVLFSGFVEGNQQLRVNGLRWGLDNQIYCAAGGHYRGYASETKIRSHRTGREIPLGSRDFRFQPDTGHFEPQSGPAQFGRNRNDWGHWFGTQNSAPLWHYVLGDEYLMRNPHVPAPEPTHQVIVPRNPRIYAVTAPEKRYHSFDQAGHFTSACSGLIYRDRYLFDDEVAHAFVCEPFHNLVHHEWVAESGVTFSARRPPDEEQSEFFASRDRWTRPVMVRTGPDGALWVADMYRYMIEHPEWLPEEGRAELLPHYREGEDKGRIYRVVRAGRPAPRPVRLDQLFLESLVLALAAPNGWQRDKAQQALLWRADPAALPHLEKLARGENPLGRLHALWTLQGLGALRPEAVARALSDSHPRIRENALRLAEKVPAPETLAAACQLAGDPDPKIALQLAFSLGEWDSPMAGEALGILALRWHTDPFVVSAILSSARPHRRALAQTVLSADEAVWRVFGEPLRGTALGFDDRDLLARLLEHSTQSADRRYSATQMSDLTGLFRMLQRRGSSPSALIAIAPRDRLSRTLQQMEPVFHFAVARMREEEAPLADRFAAARLLAHDATRRAGALELLASLLEPQQPAETQKTALQAMTDSGDENVPSLLLQRWPALEPAIRSAALGELLRREPWTFALLRAVEAGQVARHELSPDRRTRLIRHESERARGLARQLLVAVEEGSRQALVETFRPALALAGVPERGAEVFARACALCHRRDGRGHDIGPDLRSVIAHPPEKLLANIIDPNADIQPGYHAYNCVLNNGEELYGLISAESAASLILKMPDGSTRSVLRQEIASLRSANISLMPDGLEAGMTLAEMADLIAYLKTPPAEP